MSPLYPHCWGFWSWMDVGFCQMLFMHLLRWLYGFWLFFVNVMYDVYWFAYVEPSLWNWDEYHLVMVYDLFYMLLDLVGQNFVENFCIYIHQRCWPIIFFFGSLVLVLGWWQLNRMSSGVLLLLQPLGKV